MKNSVFRILGYAVHRYAVIHPVFIWNCGNIVLGKQSKLGFFSVFRDLNNLILEDGAKIGQLNWISASILLMGNGAPCSLNMHQNSVITNRHYIDASGGVTIDKASALTGVRSTLMTHGVSVLTNTQTWKPIFIAHHNLIGSNSILVPGVVTKPNSVYGMGALISGISKNDNQLILNEPSRPRRLLDNQAVFFNL
jgi:carbonic anhydrase/acetyltransferase-like protein (isoleucine patch superfamily)